MFLINKKFIFACLVFFIILFEIIFYWPRFAELKIASDSFEYHKLAINLLEGKGFYLEEAGGRTMAREPGYPFFIFLIYKIFGIHPDAVKIFQVILLFFICFLVYKLCQKYGEKGNFTAKIAVLAVAVCPLFVIFSGEIISETLAAFLVLLFCFVLLKSLETKEIYSFLAGLILGALVLTKSIFIFIPVFVLPIYWLLAKDKKILKILLFLIAFIFFIFPWFYRNHIYFNRWAIAERGGLVSYVHTSKSFLTKQQFKDYIISCFSSQYFIRLKDSSFDFFMVSVDPANKKEESLLKDNYSENEIDALLLNESKQLWLKYPFRNLLTGFTELAKANSPTVPRNSVVFVYDTSGSIWWRFMKGLVVIFIRLAWLAILLVVCYGFFQSIRRKLYFLLPLFMFIIYLNGVIFFLEGMPRFIFPIYVLYFIFFAIGVNHLKEKLWIKKI